MLLVILVALAVLVALTVLVIALVGLAGRITTLRRQVGLAAQRLDALGRLGSGSGEPR